MSWSRPTVAMILKPSPFLLKIFYMLSVHYLNIRISIFPSLWMWNVPVKPPKEATTSFLIYLITYHLRVFKQLLKSCKQPSMCLALLSHRVKYLLFLYVHIQYGYYFIKVNLSYYINAPMVNVLYANPDSIPCYTIISGNEISFTFLYRELRYI